MSELLSCLGSVNYLSRFIPELSRLRKPLQALIKKDSEFVCTVEHNRAFAEVKLAVTQPSTRFAPIPRLTQPSVW